MRLFSQDEFGLLGHLMMQVDTGPSGENCLLSHSASCPPPRSFQISHSVYDNVLIHSPAAANKMQQTFTC